MKTNPDSAAFADNDRQIGLSKREYFCSMAMQGLLAQSYGVTVKDRDFMGNKKQLIDIKIIAKASVEVADALIEALNQ